MTTLSFTTVTTPGADAERLARAGADADGSYTTSDATFKAAGFTLRKHWPEHVIKRCGLRFLFENELWLNHCRCLAPCEWMNCSCENYKRFLAFRANATWFPKDGYCICRRCTVRPDYSAFIKYEANVKQAAESEVVEEAAVEAGAA